MDSSSSIFEPAKLVHWSNLSSEGGAHVEKNHLRVDIDVLASIDLKMSLCMALLAR